MRGGDKKELGQSGRSAVRPADSRPNSTPGAMLGDDRSLASCPPDRRTIPGFRPLIRMVTDQIDALLADKGYDADAIREDLANAKIEAVNPAKTNCSNPAPQPSFNIALIAVCIRA